MTHVLDEDILSYINFLLCSLLSVKIEVSFFSSIFPRHETTTTCAKC